MPQKPDEAPQKDQVERSGGGQRKGCGVARSGGGRRKVKRGRGDKHDGQGKQKCADDVSRQARGVSAE